MRSFPCPLRGRYDAQAMPVVQGAGAGGGVRPISGLHGFGLRGTCNLVIEGGGVNHYKKVRN